MYRILKFVVGSLGLDSILPKRGSILGAISPIIVGGGEFYYRVMETTLPPSDWLSLLLFEVLLSFEANVEVKGIKRKSLWG
jgi:hypothetical protein